MYNFLTKNGQTIAFAVGALICIAFYGMVVGSGDFDQFSQWDMDGVKDKERYNLGLFDFGLMATVALIAIAAILMFAFGGFQGITNIKQSLGGIIGFGLIGIIFAVGYNSTELLDTGLEAAASKKFQLTDEVRRFVGGSIWTCLLYTSPSPRDATLSRMPSSA